MTAERPPRSLRAEAPARALFFCSPGGLERFLREVAAAESPDEAAAAAERAGLVLDDP